MPQAVLSEAARMFWLEAAAEHARLGRREATLEAVAKVSEMSGRQRRHLVAPIHLAVGDADGALKSLGYALEHLETYSGAGQLRIHLNHALALAHLGRYEPAMGAAEKAYYAAAKAEEELQGKTDALDEEVALQDDRISAAWLWGAMSLLAGKPDRLSEALRDVRSQELSDVVTWTRLAAQPEETRRAGRWDLSLATLSESALPAVMYVVSRAVPSMMDVEVWLDRIFQQEHRTQPTRAMLARAEVARWRNDPEAERNWQGRSAKLLGLVKDYRTSLLAHILELR
jgi:tetratricopeptide (TPR) repeat protein